MALKRKDNIGLLAKKLHATLRGIYRVGKISKSDYRMDYSEAIHELTKVIVAFNVAYNMTDYNERLAWIDKTVGHFEAARAIIEMMIEEKVLRELNSRQWSATSYYFFVVTRPKPREICASSMEIRIAQHVIDAALRPIMERVLPERTFNNRKGMGVTAAIDQLIDDMFSITEGYTREAYIRKKSTSRHVFLRHHVTKATRCLWR